MRGVCEVKKTLPTPEKLRALWVKALRSGEYEQALGRLRDGDTFCCLGVACEVYRKAGGDLSWRGDAALTGRSHHTNGSSLPETVRDAFGLADDEGGLTLPCRDANASEYLSFLNDSGASFKRIATLIEKNKVALA